MNTSRSSDNMIEVIFENLFFTYFQVSENIQYTFIYKLFSVNKEIQDKKMWRDICIFVGNAEGRFFPFLYCYAHRGNIRKPLIFIDIKRY